MNQSLDRAYLALRILDEIRKSNPKVDQGIAHEIYAVLEEWQVSKPVVPSLELWPIDFEHRR